MDQETRSRAARRTEDVGVEAVAKALLQPYVFPFELASVVLLAVLVGAVVIAKEDTPMDA